MAVDRRHDRPCERLFGQGRSALFHEFPITGDNCKWTLTDARKIAIELPGEETETLKP